MPELSSVPRWQSRAGTASDNHRVVIIGAGFAGLSAAKALRGASADITIVDRTNHHLFQPLLYQVATGAIPEGDIAPPTREILRRQRNARVVLGDVVHIDITRRDVVIQGIDRQARLTYDSLIVAAGAGQSYFGHAEFATHAPGMKTLDDALNLRGRIFGAFEMAELGSDPESREAWLTFAVIGAGPTGVELAGQLAELSRRALKGNYRSFDPADARIILLDAGDTVLPTFPPSLQRRAHKDLERSGVDIRLGTRVTGVSKTEIVVESSAGTVTRIQTNTKAWAAGIEASPLGTILAEQAGARIDRAGRVAVLADCTLPGHPEVFVVGDLMSLDKLPAVAEVAMQSGHHAAKTIARRLKEASKPKPFRYHDFGTMATIARFRGLVWLGRIRLTGSAAWLIWLVVHLAFLTGYRNRLFAVGNWVVTFLGRERRHSAISEQQMLLRTDPSEVRAMSIGQGESVAPRVAHDGQRNPAL
jgi:NADH dehydrogenase